MHVWDSIFRKLEKLITGYFYWKTELSIEQICCYKKISILGKMKRAVLLSKGFWIEIKISENISLTFRIFFASWSKPFIIFNYLWKNNWIIIYFYRLTDIKQLWSDFAFCTSPDLYLIVRVYLIIFREKGTRMNLMTNYDIKNIYFWRI